MIIELFWIFQSVQIAEDVRTLDAFDRLKLGASGKRKKELKSKKKQSRFTKRSLLHLELIQLSKSTLQMSTKEGIRSIK